MFKNLEIPLEKRQRLWMGLVLVGMLIAAILEMLGIGDIAGFVTLLSNPEALLERLPDGALSSWIRENEFSVIALYGAALLAVIFVIKNISSAA